MWGGGGEDTLKRELRGGELRGWLGERRRVRKVAWVWAGVTQEVVVWAGLKSRRARRPRGRSRLWTVTMSRGGFWRDLQAAATGMPTSSPVQKIVSPVAASATTWRANAQSWGVEKILLRRRSTVVGRALLVGMWKRTGSRSARSRRT